MVAVLNSLYDFAESTTDDYTDSHVKHIATHGEFLEFIQKFTHNLILLLLFI